MPFFAVPEALGLALCFILWPVFQVSSAVICKMLPVRYLNAGNFWFMPHRWEKNGHIYQKLFKVRRWKRYLPDGAAVIRGGFRKNKMADFSGANLEKFLIESCRAELTHLFAVPPFVLFGLFEPPKVVILMLVYALLVNMPCVIAQRYNRPRVQKLLAAKAYNTARSQRFIPVRH